MKLLDPNSSPISTKFAEIDPSSIDPLNIMSMPLRDSQTGAIKIPNEVLFE